MGAPMNVRCGTDIIHISRLSRAISRLGPRFLRRIWTPAELALLGVAAAIATGTGEYASAGTGTGEHPVEQPASPDPAANAGQPSTRQPDVRPDPELALSAGTLASLAARFAGKEAIAKALGTGIGPRGIAWTDLEILREPSGAPVVRLHGAARDLYVELGGQSLALSLTHDQNLAQAFCVMLCQPLPSA